MSRLGFINTVAKNDKEKERVPTFNGHTLTIGQTGCGKTTSIIRPLIEKSIKDGRAIFLFDEKNLLHMDLKYLDDAPIENVFQLGGIANGTNDLKINLLDMLQSKKQFQKFANALMKVSSSGEGHKFWAQGAANMLSDIYQALFSIKKLLQYASRNFCKELLTVFVRIMPDDSKLNENPLYEYTINSQPLTITELFSYFESRIKFKAFAEYHQELLQAIRDVVSFTFFLFELEDKYLKKLDELYCNIENDLERLKKWKISLKSQDASGNNGVYFTVGASLGDLAVLETVNHPNGDSIINILEDGKHVVVNSEVLPSQVTSILFSRTLDILSLRAKRKNIQPVSVIVDEASRVLNEDSELHTDFLRQAKVFVHLAIQHESQLIEKFGKNKYQTYQTNFQEIFRMATYEQVIPKFQYYSHYDDEVYSSKPMFLEEEHLLKFEYIYQQETNQYPALQLENEVVVYDARLYEETNEVLLIDIKTFEERLVVYHNEENIQGYVFRELYEKERGKSLEQIEDATKSICEPIY